MSVRASGRVLAGNLKAIPSGLPVSGLVGQIQIPVAAAGRTERQNVRAVALPLSNGSVVVLGRSVKAVDAGAKPITTI